MSNPYDPNSSGPPPAPGAGPPPGPGQQQAPGSAPQGPPPPQGPSSPQFPSYGSNPTPQAPGAPQAPGSAPSAPSYGSPSYGSNPAPGAAPAPAYGSNPAPAYGAAQSADQFQPANPGSGGGWNAAAPGGDSSKNIWGLLALIAGIVGIVLGLGGGGLLFSIAGIVLGIIGGKNVAKGVANNPGQAKTGLWTGVIGIVVNFIAAIVIGLLIWNFGTVEVNGERVNDGGETTSQQDPSSGNDPAAGTDPAAGQDPAAEDPAAEDPAAGEAPASDPASGSGGGVQAAPPGSGTEISEGVEMGFMLSGDPSSSDPLTEFTLSYRNTGTEDYDASSVTWSCTYDVGPCPQLYGDPYVSFSEYGTIPAGEVVTYTTGFKIPMESMNSIEITINDQNSDAWPEPYVITFG